MGISIYIPTPPEPEPVPLWQSILDDTKWVANSGTWDGVKWSSGSGYFDLDAIGTWATGFRPTNMRVSFTGGSTISYTLYDAFSSAITNPAGVANGVAINPPLPLIYTTGTDITNIALQASSPPGTITDIEFYGLPI
jgi:hypothetical protein